MKLESEKIGTLIVAIVLIASLGLPLFTVNSSAQSPPPLPDSFYGDVYLNGNPAPEGVNLVAMINGEPEGSIITGSNGTYGNYPDGPYLDIEGENDDVGELINFKLSSLEVNSTDPADVKFQGGRIKEVDLYFVGTLSNVTVTAPEDTNEYMPDTYTYDFNVTNDEAEERDIDLSVESDNPSIFSADVQDTVTIGASSYMHVGVDVTISDTAVRNDEANITLTATDPISGDTANDTFNIRYWGYGVDVIAPENTTVDDIGTYNFNFTVDNVGTEDDTYDLNITSDNANFTVTAVDNVTLAGKESTEVEVTVELAPETSLGGSAVITFNATNGSGNSTDEETMMVTYGNFGVDITAPEDMTEYNYGTYTYSLMVNNTGDFNDTYDIAVESDNTNFEVTAPSTVDVAAGTVEMVDLNVTIVEGAVHNESAVLTFNVTSQNSAMTSEDSMTLTLMDDEAPMAHAGADQTVDMGTEVTFNGTGSSDNLVISEYEWTFTYDGSEVVLNGEMPSYTFDIAGTYEVTLMVTDTGGHNDTDVMNVTVVDTVDPEVTDESPTTAGTGDQFIFRATATDNVGIDTVTVTWWTDVTSEMSAEMILQEDEYVFPTSVPSGASEWHYMIEAADAEGNTASTGEVMISVTDNNAPLADAGDDVTIGQGEEVNFDGTGSSDNIGIVDYTWTFIYEGGEVELTGETAAYTFETVGTYEVELTVTDDAGNSATDTMMVTVEDTQAPTADAGADQNVGVGDTVTFDGTGSTDNVGVVSYEWTFEYQGETQTLTGAEPEFTFDVVGTYEVTLTVMDEAGNSDTAPMTVNVQDTVPPSADAGDDQTISVGDEVTFDGTGSSDNVGVTEYIWTFTYDGSSQELSGAEPSFTFDNVGAYTVTLTVVDDAGYTASDTMTVTVEDTTAPTADAGDDQTVDEGEEVTFDGTGSSDNVGIVSYEWDFDDGGSGTGESPTHTYDEPGTYTVTLTVTDDAGNTDTDTMEVEVKETGVVAGLGWAELLGIIAIIIIIIIIILYLIMGKKPGEEEEELEEEPEITEEDFLEEEEFEEEPVEEEFLEEEEFEEEPAEEELFEEEEEFEEEPAEEELEEEFEEEEEDVEEDIFEDLE